MSYGADKNPTPQQKAENLYVILGDMGPEFIRLSKVVQHLSYLADHIEGSRPQEAAAPSGADVDSSMIMGARRKLDNLRMLCQQLEGETNRVAQAVGGMSNSKVVQERT